MNQQFASGVRTGLQSNAEKSRLFGFFFRKADKKDKDAAAADTATVTKADTAPKTPTTPTKASKVASAAGTPAPSASACGTAQSAPSAPLGVSLEKVDLGKISSILSSLTSAMKNTSTLLQRVDGTLLQLVESPFHTGQKKRKPVKTCKQSAVGKAHPTQVNIGSNLLGLQR